MSDFDEERREIINDLSDLEQDAGHEKEASNAVPDEDPSDLSTDELIDSLGSLQKQAEEGNMAPSDTEPSKSPDKGDATDMPNDESAPSGESAKSDGETEGVPSGASAKNEGEQSGVPSGGSAQNEGTTETNRTDGGSTTDGAPMENPRTSKKQAGSKEDLPEEMQEQAEEAEEEGGVDEANDSDGDSEESSEGSEEDAEEDSDEGSDDDMPEDVKEELNDKEAGEGGGSSANPQQVSERLDEKCCHDLNKVAQSLETEILEESVQKAVRREADEESVRDLNEKVAEARDRSLGSFSNTSDEDDTNAFIDSL